MDCRLNCRLTLAEGTRKENPLCKNGDLRVIFRHQGVPKDTREQAELGFLTCFKAFLPPHSGTRR